MKDRMQDLTIVIPWRDADDDWRDGSFDWVMHRYMLLFPNTEIIVSDTGAEEFNRAQFINAGVAQARTKYVLIADADTIAHYRFVHEGLVLLEGGEPWVIPYGDADYYNLDERCSQWIVKLTPDVNIHPSVVTWEHKLKSWSGQVLMRTDDFALIGGFDPRFRGWGYEDNAFTLAADTLLGQHVRVRDGYAMHIWHPAPVEKTWEQPHIDMNRALYAQYQLREGKGAAMLDFVNGGDE